VVEVDHSSSCPRRRHRIPDNWPVGYIVLAVRAIHGGAGVPAGREFPAEKRKGGHRAESARNLAWGHWDPRSSLTAAPGYSLPAGQSAQQAGASVRKQNDHSKRGMPRIIPPETNLFRLFISAPGQEELDKIGIIRTASQPLQRTGKESCHNRKTGSTLRLTLHPPSLRTDTLIWSIAALKKKHIWMGRVTPDGRSADLPSGWSTGHLPDPAYPAHQEASFQQPAVPCRPTPARPGDRASWQH